ncbi:Iron/zinc purple acid phosphatase-like C-terminal domain-containing protein [Cynara cardunculus var. scolymus]|uniref:Purple acid phosphatase n=1 Tax=Cynara cardunculus var. scolymus TaxID=59895 RepID=A0A118JY94_CYNCS|nr:Iron/zinc purple acid phosphatase-like C-terminal domain-containing protein [Cynara cardunculus var. scolymus]
MMMNSSITLFFFLTIFIGPSISESVSLSISSNSLSKSNNSVTINWSRVDSPSQLDWIGIYSPPNSSLYNYIGYLYLNTSPTWESGSGSITIPLINLRSKYKLRIFRWSESEIIPTRHDHDHNPLPQPKHLLAETEEFEFEQRHGPDQIHLALTGEVGEIRVMFVSGHGKESVVRYGSGPDRMDQVVETRVGRYEMEDMCDSPANQSVGWRDPGFIHDGVMVNLKPGKSFVSPDEDSGETIAFLYGDMGTATPYNTFVRTQDESISTIKWIARDIESLGDKPAMISHIGDISYARGYSWLWDHFFNQIEPVASKVPYHVCIGNHEYDWPLQPWKPDWAMYIYAKDGGGECGIPYSLKFNMPGNSSESTGSRAPATRNLYYSFNFGVVHFVYLSTETNFLKGSKQYEFLKKDLESVDRVKTPFVVVQGHRPMYTTSNEVRDRPIREKMLEHLEPLLVDNNVNLALWGHVHRYERFCPINNFTCGSGPVHVVIGMAGQDWQPIWEPRPNHLTDPIFPQPARSIYRGGEFGYTKLIANKEKLTFTYIGNHDGETHDAVEILASGKVINGEITNMMTDEGKHSDDSRGKSGKTSYSWYALGAAVVLFCLLSGYLVGLRSRAKKETVTNKEWTPVKTTEEA